MRRRRSRDIVHRHEGNPIIDISDLAFKAADICNAGAVKVDGEYLLLITIQALQGYSAIYLARSDDGKCLGIMGHAAGFEGERRGNVTLCPLTAANAAVLRDKLPWLRPRPLGLQTSAGCGDRLGLATPGHIRAARKAAGIAPKAGYRF